MWRNGKQLEIPHLFFGEDALILRQPEADMLLNLRCVFLSFQAVSGLKINLNKSELVGFEESRIRNSLAWVMGCKAVKLPIKYLGILLGAKFKNRREVGIRWLRCLRENMLGGKENSFLKGVD